MQTPGMTEVIMTPGMGMGGGVVVAPPMIAPTLVMPGMGMPIGGTVIMGQPGYSYYY